MKRKTITKAQRDYVYNKFNGRCAYCGCSIKPEELQVDHFAPLSLFGDNLQEHNLMPSCRACNKFKSNKTITKFRKDLKEAIENPSTLTDFTLRVKYRDLIKEHDGQIKFLYEQLVEKPTDDTV